MTFYTYLWLREDGTPYYVGKGSGNRGFIFDCHTVTRPKDSARILTQEYSSEKDAFEAEKFFISYYGRKDLGTGCLRNMTDGGEGASNPSEQTRHKMRLRSSIIGKKTYIYLIPYQTPELSAKWGRLGGKKTRDSGQLLKAAYLGGLVTGRMNAESGRMVEVQKLSNHVRWHTNRNIVRENCPLCKESQCHG